jgi:hypothetical protein
MQSDIAIGIELVSYPVLRNPEPRPVKKDGFYALPEL